MASKEPEIPDIFSTNTKLPEFDINSAFESIACSEETIYAKAYDEGFLDAQKTSDSVTDAFHSGIIQTIANHCATLFSI